MPEHERHPTGFHSTPGLGSSSSGQCAAASSSTVGEYSCLHQSHSRLASRCARTQSTDEPTRNGSIPISVRRVTALGASLVCSVESTRWPVSAASTASCAVRSEEHTSELQSHHDLVCRLLLEKKKKKKKYTFLDKKQKNNTTH